MQCVEIYYASYNVFPTRFGQFLNMIFYLRSQLHAVYILCACLLCTLKRSDEADYCFRSSPFVGMCVCVWCQKPNNYWSEIEV